MKIFEVIKFRVIPTFFKLRKMRNTQSDLIFVKIEARH